MRVDEKNLVIADKKTYAQEKAEAEVAIRAIEIIESLAEAIEAAGGGATVERIANSSIKEFAIMAARNNITVDAAYCGSAEAVERKRTVDHLRLLSPD